MRIVKFTQNFIAPGDSNQWGWRGKMLVGVLSHY